MVSVSGAVAARRSIATVVDVRLMATRLILSATAGNGVVVGAIKPVFCVGVGTGGRGLAVPLMVS